MRTCVPPRPRVIVEAPVPARRPGWCRLACLGSWDELLSSASRTPSNAASWARSSAGSSARACGLVAAELRTITVEVAAAHYAEHQGKPFFDDLVAFITRSPVVVMVVEGPDDTFRWCAT